MLGAYTASATNFFLPNSGGTTSKVRGVNDTVGLHRN